MIPLTGAGVACNIGNLTNTSAVDLFGATNFLSLTKVEDDLDKMMLLTNYLLYRYPNNHPLDQNLHGCPNKHRYGWKFFKYNRTADTWRPEAVQKAEKLRKDDERDTSYSAQNAKMKKEKEEKEKEEKKMRQKHVR